MSLLLAFAIFALIMDPGKFQFFKPCKALLPYVRYYWVFKSGQVQNTLTFPIGCPQIIFHRQTPLYIPELNACQPKFAISGQVNYSSHFYASDNVDMVVVVFWPHGLRAFFNLPISVFYNMEVSGYDLENRALKILASQVFNSEDDFRCIGVIEQWLLSQIEGGENSKTAYNLKRLSVSIRQLFETPSLSVEALASTVCLSKKQFERLFKDVVGANPKEYARIVRFQKSLKLLQSYPECGNLTQLSYRCGYADQSHFIREFRQFSGYSPLALMDVCEPYSDLFTNPI